MATAAAMGCFTLTWEIKNFSVFLSQRGSLLQSKDFWMITSERSEGRTILLCDYLNCLKFVVLGRKKNSKDSQFFERIEFSILSSSKEIPVNEHSFPISKDTILGSNGESLLHDDTLTICCRIQKPRMETGKMCIRTVLLKDNLIWNIKNFHYSCLSYNKNVEKEHLLFYLFLERKESYIYTFQVEAKPNIGGCVSIVYFSPSIDVYHGQIRPLSGFLHQATRSWKIEVFANTISGNFQLHMETIYAVHKEVSDKPSSHGCTCKGSATEVVTGSSDSLNFDLLHLYRTALHSDATIQTEGRSFPVHKGILSIRSEVFRAMFEKDEMSEGRSGVVDIDDVDSETVDRMLVFLYGDSLDDLQWEEAAALYYAADKYAVHTLKQKCADILKAKLSVANVCDVLVLADQHSDQDLMTCTLNFILDHKEVISSPDWEKLEESNSRLTSKVTKEILLKKWGN